MTQWYFSYNGERIGPLDDATARDQAQRRPDGHCWRAGFDQWLPIRQVTELHESAAAALGTPPPPPGRQAGDDEIDYHVRGTDMQFVEIELDPGESAIAEAGALMYKESAVQMDTVFGDGSRSGQGGLMGKLFSAGKRVLSGETLFTTVFTHTGRGKAHVAFAAPYPGTVMPMRLADLGGRLICQKDAFLCAARGVSLGLYFQKRILTGLFGGEGFIMQQLDGDGWVFVHAGGTVVERELAPGERLDVDTGCVVAFTESVSMDVQAVGGIKSMLFGGEGMFLATLTGPGRIWLQSLPFSRLAGRMLAAAPRGGGERRGEGSILGGLGDLIGGDSNF